MKCRWSCVSIRSIPIRQHLKWKFILFLLLPIAVYVYFEFHFGADKCYNRNYNAKRSEHIDLLDDILESKVQPRFGKSIFFHETSCKSGIVSINARQACAIESAARANPNADIFLMFTSPVGFVNNASKSNVIEAILSYENVQLRNLNLWTYVDDTPLSAFFRTNRIFQSRYLVSHLSDLLRYVSLFKWGGTYLDLDVIVKHSLDSYENYAAAESIQTVGSSMMNFDYGPIGRNVALKCLQDFEKNFNGRNWGINGPGVITRVLASTCNTSSTAMMTHERCLGFRVLMHSAVFAVHYTNWEYFFDENFANYVLDATKDSIAVHVWNKKSASTSVRVGSAAAYGILARDYCPRVYGSCGDYI